MSETQRQQERGQAALDASSPRPRRGHKKRAPVVGYLILLFLAAFFLLALSYFMQQRTMAESLDGLKASVSAMEKAETLQAENAGLKTELNTLRDELEALQEENARLTGELEAAHNAVDAQSRTAEAMDWFWQIDEAYVRGRYALARDLITQMDDTLVAFLPAESLTDTDRYSPLERYQEIYDILY